MWRREGDDSLATRRARKTKEEGRVWGDFLSCRRGRSQKPLSTFFPLDPKALLFFFQHLFLSVLFALFFPFSPPPPFFALPSIFFAPKGLSCSRHISFLLLLLFYFPFPLAAAHGTGRPKGGPLERGVSFQREVKGGKLDPPMSLSFLSSDGRVILVLDQGLQQLLPGLQLLGKEVHGRGRAWGRVRRTNW